MSATLRLSIEGFLVPVEEFLYTFVDFDLVRPAEAVELAHVDELARGAVGLACVKHDFTFETNRLHDEFAEFTDGEFLARTHVDVAVADFTELRDGAATACAVVAVHCAIDARAVMHTGIFFDADNVTEVHIQEHMNGCVGHVFAPEEFAERLAGSPEGHLVVLDAVLGKDLQNFILRSVAVDAFDGALVHIDLDAIPVIVVDELREVDFAHHGGHHVAVFQMEVVIRAVKVRGHHGEVVGAVLQVVAFAHLEARNLCNGVFLVGVFEFAREEGVFLHGLRGVLRVDASRAEEQKLLHVVSVGFAEHVALDLHVHHHEVRAIERVCHDASYKGCGKHHCIGTFFVKELLDGILVGKVKFLVCAADKVVVPAGLEVVPDGRTDQPMVASDINL